MSQTQINKKFPFKMGADPEFLLFHGSTAIDASHIINTFFKKTKLPAMGMGYKVEGAGEIGWDGASSTGELRPDPSDSPRELTANIEKLIAQIGKTLPYFDFTTLSIGSPIGGHIHLESPRKFTRGSYVTTEDMKERDRMTKLLATFLMPIVASEHRVSSAGRLNCGYGRLDDIRWEQRGEQSTEDDGRKISTAEVRGMSAEWLSTPKMAYATFCYLGVVWNEILKNNKTLIKNKTVLKTKTHIDSVHKMMLCDYRIIESAVTQNIKTMVKEFELYKDFKDEIDFILSPKKCLKEKEKNGWTLNKGWGMDVNGYKNPTKKDLLDEKKIKKELLRLERADMDSIVGIPYNDDYKVSLFAQAITDRITALNWGLKNEYFLFGLKKEVTGTLAMRTDTKTFFTIPENMIETAIVATTTKMSKKIEDIRNRSIRIDPKSGKTKSMKTNQVIIGLDYKERTEEKINKLIELIWSIENNKMQDKKLSELPVATAKEETTTITDTIQEAFRHNRITDDTHVEIPEETLNEILYND